MTFKMLDLGADPAEVSGYSGRKFYRLATITWSRPRWWDPAEDFEVPQGWAGHGGIYAFIRHHGNQLNGPEVAYVGKANRFEKRLVKRHQHFDIVRRRGGTKVTCGRIAFERIRASASYYTEIEGLIILCLWQNLENTQCLESLPGFRTANPARAMKPWVITNERYLFGGRLPKRIAYPAIVVGR